MTKGPHSTNKLLSIQSHVIHGYVGNRAATFPLQMRGWDVDCLNTVQFSNHPAYGSFKGTKFGPETLKEFYRGLKDIGINYDAVLTGYVPSDEALSVVFDMCKDLASHGVKWILDPVLGDNGKIYVSQGNVDLGVKVTDLESFKNAIDTFNELYNVENLIVTSVQLSNDSTSLYSAGSTRILQGVFKSFYFKVQTIPAQFSGSGDLFSGLLTSAIYKYNEKYGSSVNINTQLEKLPLAYALNEVLSIVEKVLTLTYEHELNKYTSRSQPVPSCLKINDLKLIQARHYYTQELRNFTVHSF
ncbi:K00868 pyridoxine kinase [Cyberlindnera jadinii]|uniref:pyridoxal kinase n=1 Tax=Cyberlindnera jadinii (strain ATCC 18201 / CBS 1600 / BCRC 20928 / JCM 3617 / NBRC 0987 / NRRL Y-1542) TaxID=983966 RepID=A0A0H5C2H9_CYBJN|nr:K00868 pyridoxine kinase [Cyberlindnera jadinii]